MDMNVNDQPSTKLENSHPDRMVTEPGTWARHFVLGEEGV
jgi:hypothetical protein